MSTRSKENPGNQTTVSGHDYQKFEEIFHFRSNGKLSKSLYSVFINLFTVSTVFLVFVEDNQLWLTGTKGFVDTSGPGRQER